MSNRLSARAFLLALSLAAPGLAGSATQVKLVVDRSDDQTRAQVQAQGGVLVEDYGGFSLWRLEQSRLDALGPQGRRAVRQDLDVIALRGRRLDTREPQPREPELLRQSRSAGRQLWLVQFVGPIKAAWLAALRQTGADIVTPISGTAYVVWADGATLDRIDAQVQGRGPLQWDGPYHPAYRLAPALQAAARLNPDRPLDVMVQLYTTPEVEASLEALRAWATTVLRGPWRVLAFTNIALRLPARSLAELANAPDVFNIEPWSEPRRLDERQDQIVAGNLTSVAGATVPEGPGYLDWLRSKGFPSSPSAYPIVAVIDDGLDNGQAAAPGHPDFREAGEPTTPSRVTFVRNCTASPEGDSPEGHGTLDAAIVGAYNDHPGFPHVDADGFALDVGASPFGRLGAVKIFDDHGRFDLSACGHSDASIVAPAYAAGAAITSNSWGAFPFGDPYDATAQAWDALTRDARPDLPGNQEMLHVFAAGNDGPFGISSPALAKNVLAVGATENVRDQGVADRCFVVDADNADDMAAFSSQGPTGDGRARPDLVAPGTHIQGAASQEPAFNGRGLCGNAGADIRYYPPGQTLYTWSSGTSHSTPAVAGAASLALEYTTRVRYLSGSGAGDTLPGAVQGWGAVNLRALFDDTPRVVVDEDRSLLGTGAVRTWTGRTVDASRPVRVSLVWTDPPGPTTGGLALVNDLDLQVLVDATEYRGNVFQGPLSVAGGEFDHHNTVENVFLPAGTSGNLVVRVIGRNIAADGVPGNREPLDQDFALVITNAEATQVPAPELSVAERRVADTGPGANGILEPGDRALMEFDLKNSGPSTASAVSATLQPLDPAVHLVNGYTDYADIRPGQKVRPQSPFTFSVDGAVACGQPLRFGLTIVANGMPPSVQEVTLDSGALANGQRSFSYSGPPVPFEPLFAATPHSHLAEAFGHRDFRFGPEIERRNGARQSYGYPTYTYYEAVVPLEVTLPPPGTVRDVDVHVDMTHPAVEELFFGVIPPGARVAPDLSFFSASGANFTGTIFDDEAALSILDGTAPYTGRFRPISPLSEVDGSPGNGVWKLDAFDVFAGNSGVVNGFGLDITFDQLGCAGPVPAPAPVLTALSPGSVDAGAPATVTVYGSGFVADSVVHWNGAERPSAYLSEKRLVVTLSAADLAHGDTGLLTVVTPPPGGGASLPLMLRIRR